MKYSINYISKKYRGMNAYTGALSVNELRSLLESDEIIRITGLFSWLMYLGYPSCKKELELSELKNIV